MSPSSDDGTRGRVARRDAQGTHRNTLTADRPSSSEAEASPDPSEQRERRATRRTSRSGAAKAKRRPVPIHQNSRSVAPPGAASRSGAAKAKRRPVPIHQTARASRRQAQRADRERPKRSGGQSRSISTASPDRSVRRAEPVGGADDEVRLVIGIDERQRGHEILDRQRDTSARRLHGPAGGVRVTVQEDGSGERRLTRRVPGHLRLVVGADHGGVHVRTGDGRQVLVRRRGTTRRSCGRGGCTSIALVSPPSSPPVARPDTRRGRRGRHRCRRTGTPGRPTPWSFRAGRHRPAQCRRPTAARPAGVCRPDRPLPPDRPAGRPIRRRNGSRHRAHRSSMTTTVSA